MSRYCVWHAHFSGIIPLVDGKETLWRAWARTGNVWTRDGGRSRGGVQQGATAHSAPPSGSQSPTERHSVFPRRHHPAFLVPRRGSSRSAALPTRHPARRGTRLRAPRRPWRLPHSGICGECGASQRCRGDGAAPCGPAARAPPPTRRCPGTCPPPSGGLPLHRLVEAAMHQQASELGSPRI